VSLLNKSKQWGVFFTFFLISSPTFLCQKRTVAKVSDQLAEISGMAFLNDSVLIAHNDSGNDPILFFLSLKGEIIHSVLIENATNVDWEDITTDKENIYIGDIGNNRNARKNLCIYKINSHAILNKKTVSAETIFYSYDDQTAFPPTATDLHYDAESLAFYRDSLYIFTKCRAVPWDGISYCYALPIQPGNYRIARMQTLLIGTDGWKKDSATGVDIQNNKCYLLTYNRLLVFDLEKNQFLFDKEISLSKVSQYEAIAVDSKENIYIASEKFKTLFGGKLYTIKNKRNEN
jgi:hypothetical protein